MSLDLLTESIVDGFLFMGMEAGFTSIVAYAHQKSKTKFPYPLLKNSEDPLRGHSYPIMFALGSMAAPYMQYVQPLVERVVGSVGSYTMFGLGICAVEYACGKITDTISGKINFLGKPIHFDLAPWREVYQYLEQRVQEAFPATKKMPVPLTLGNKSVFLPLLPVWCAVGAFVEYVHGKLSG